MKTVFSITQAANYLGLRERMLADGASAGKIPHRKIGKEYFFDRDELDRWWDAQPGHKIPADSTDTQPDTIRADERPDGPSHPPIKLTRGPRHHVSAASVQEQRR